jgi:cytochrome c peroxidase
MARWVLPLTLSLFSVSAVVFGDSPPAVIPKDTWPARLSLSEVPLGLGERQTPEENPLTEARVQLGRRLFFDPILSADQTIACASCHAPDHGFASAGLPRGIRGKALTRRAPTLLNRAFGTAFFWDGREDSLEKQALRPIADPDEMGSSVPDVLKRLEGAADYKALFQMAFPEGVTAANLGRAIACFERVLLRGGSAVDRFRRNGEHAALTPAERHGLWLYESKGRCWRCHSGPNFSDERYHNTGVSWGKDPPDLGRFAVTRKETDRGKFKTPTLRGVALTAPYMHDASLKTLEEVVEFYNCAGGANPNRDPLLAPLELTRDEISDLVAFLKAL